MSALNETPYHTIAIVVAVEQFSDGFMCEMKITRWLLKRKFTIILHAVMMIVEHILTVQFIAFYVSFSMFARVVNALVEYELFFRQTPKKENETG